MTVGSFMLIVFFLIVWRVFRDALRAIVATLIVGFALLFMWRGLQEFSPGMAHFAERVAHEYVGLIELYARKAWNELNK